jgi:hypothetical protein
MLPLRAVMHCCLDMPGDHPAAEIHNIVGAGKSDGAMDASNLLKVPGVACIGQLPFADSSVGSIFYWMGLPPVASTQAGVPVWLWPWCLRSWHWSATHVLPALQPMLARGELRCIGATTLDEYRQYIEKDPALERCAAACADAGAARCLPAVLLLAGLLPSTVPAPPVLPAMQRKGNSSFRVQQPLVTYCMAHRPRM